MKNTVKKPIFKISCKNHRKFEILKYKQFMNQNYWKYSFNIQNKLFLVEIKSTRVKILMFPCKKLTFLFFSENSEIVTEF
jgi:hypothetical protein